MSESLARAGDADDLARTFGRRSVDPAEKQALVDEVFHGVARRYDLMNDLMSGGLHRAWKAAMVGAMAMPSKRSGRPFRVLDVAGGTGDIAFRILERHPAAHVTVLDINGSMLAVGRERAQRMGHGPERIAFVEADAQVLPFADHAFDAWTVAFGIRNVPHMDRAFAEAHRVLAFGGQLLVLEFSRVDLPGLDRLYETWSRRAIPAIGRMVAGDGEPYRYLVESIERFPGPERLEAIIRTAGFARVSHTPMTGGIAALHRGWKL